MKTITLKNYREEILAQNGPTVLFVHKAAGCQNCEQIKPLMARFEQNNPGVLVLSLQVKDGSEVPEEFQFRTFPGIFSFVGGQPLRCYAGFKNAEQLRMLFMTDRDIKAELYDLPKRIEFFEKELEMYNRDAAVVKAIVVEEKKEGKGKK